MAKTIEQIQKERQEEYETVATQRKSVLDSIDALNEFSTKEHYRVSLLKLVEASEGKIALSRIQLVHPDRVILNKVRDELEAEGKIESIKDGQTVFIQLKAQEELPPVPKNK